MIAAHHSVGSEHAEHVFRYLRFKVDLLQGGTTNTLFQCSKLVLLDDNGLIYQWPLSTLSVRYFRNESGSGGSDAAAVEYPDSPFSQDHQAGWGESPFKMFDGNTGTKFCNAFPPMWFTIDLGEGNSVDLEIYNRWQWWTANDSVQYNRNAIDFSLSASNDGMNWKVVDEVEGYTTTWQNKSIGYEGSIKL